jgi:dienelactone hydrolase
MPCLECFTGHIKSAEPKGHTAEVHGRKTYIARPEGTPKGIVVIVPDAFGWEFVNNRLLADHYAEQGQFKVYLPDFMDGSAASLWMMDVLPQLTKTRTTWSEFFGLPYLTP